MSKVRIASEGDFYHVTTRGVAQHNIFEDDDDREFMLKLLRNSTEKHQVEILAWCFMSNHVHLLIHAPLSNVAVFMNSLLSRYARYYNKRHSRSGHLFQERFYSTPIDTDEYLLVAVRYIHFNPHGIGVKDIERYRWSSYREYLYGADICNTTFILKLFDGIGQFKNFHGAPNNDQASYSIVFEAFDTQETPTDDELIAFAKRVLGIENLSSIAQTNKDERNRMISILKSRLTIQQIVRITGLGRNVIQRAK